MKAYRVIDGFFDGVGLLLKLVIYGIPMFLGLWYFTNITAAACITLLICALVVLAAYFREKSYKRHHG